MVTHQAVDQNVSVLAICLDVGDENYCIYAWRSGDETILTAWMIDGKGVMSLDLGRCTVVDALGYTRSTVLQSDLRLTVTPIHIRDIENRHVVQTLIDTARQHEKQ